MLLMSVLSTIGFWLLKPPQVHKKVDIFAEQKLNSTITTISALNMGSPERNATEPAGPGECNERCSIQ